LKCTEREEIIDYNDSQPSNKKSLILKQKYLYVAAKIDSKVVDPKQRNKQQMKLKITLKKM